MKIIFIEKCNRQTGYGYNVCVNRGVLIQEGSDVKLPVISLFEDRHYWYGIKHYADPITLITQGVE